MRASLTLELVLTFIVSTIAINSDIYNNTVSIFFESNPKSNDSNLADFSFNPDDYLNVPQIIKRHGYPSESHIVRTLDGYLLTLFRIPASRGGKGGGQPVLLQHGLSGDSAPWVICDNNSLGKFRPESFLMCSFYFET